jgi:hypothetical protein
MTAFRDADAAAVSWGLAPPARVGRPSAQMHTAKAGGPSATKEGVLGPF